VNNDHQRVLKGSTVFQKEQERVFIVSNIKSVDIIVFYRLIKTERFVKLLRKLHNILIKNITLILQMEVIKITTPSQKDQSVIK